MKRRWTLTLVAVAALLGATAPAGYLAFLRAPTGNPADACPAADGRPVVVAAGASITQGTLGGDWVGGLRRKPELAGYDLVNAGINGNTSADLLGRLDTDVVACRPEAVAVLVGTNDVRGEVPVPEYRANLVAIVERIRAGSDARIALASLPPLGEDPGTEINRRLEGYNAAVREVAEQTDAGYLPVHERMTALLAGQTEPFAFSFGVAFWAAVQHYTFRRSWDEVAEAGGRTLLVDHIHLSDRGAAQVTDLVATWLLAG
ncbi:GDSL-type esterase/lipase family protein [Actinoplanes sp. NBC_00393]|uniref:SGNH/GDSL hydrolase family protein n=1 Tax=Actinoplanes sp. NBC_00393 TaxID=2975953 RepID=UPI002E2257CB